MKKILNISKIILWIVLFFTSIILIQMENRKIRCKSIGVIIPDSLEYRFVSKASVLKEIQKKFKIIDRSLDSIRTDKIEEELSILPSVQNVQVYRKITNGKHPNNGILLIEVTQKEPLFRVMGKHGNFYVDKVGETMPLSPNYTARVPIIQGDVTKEFATNELFKLIHFIQNNDFWRAQITQVQVAANKELLLVPRIGNHLIEFGKVDNYESKFEKLMALYENAFNSGNWNEFKRINLKYENQIVCTKK